MCERVKTGSGVSLTDCVLTVLTPSAAAYLHQCNYKPFKEEGVGAVEVLSHRRPAEDPNHSYFLLLATSNDFVLLAVCFF